MKEYYLISKIEFDVKFRAKYEANFNTKLKKTLNNSNEGSDFKLAIFNRL